MHTLNGKDLKLRFETKKFIALLVIQMEKLSRPKNSQMFKSCSKEHLKTSFLMDWLKWRQRIQQAGGNQKLSIQRVLRLEGFLMRMNKCDQTTICNQMDHIKFRELFIFI